jgi:hypothetical protein
MIPLLIPQKKGSGKMVGLLKKITRRLGITIFWVLEVMGIPRIPEKKPE